MTFRRLAALVIVVAALGAGAWLLSETLRLL
jgi:hypothetical protein